MTASVIVSPRRPASADRSWLPVTLVAAMLAVALIGTIMLSMRPGSSQNMQGVVQPTASATHTATPTPIPTATPIANLTSVIAAGQFNATNLRLPSFARALKDVVVYSQPDTNTSVAFELSKGMFVTAFAQTPDNLWTQVYLRTGLTDSVNWKPGWVQSDSIELTDPVFISPGPTRIQGAIIPNNIILCYGVIGVETVQIFPHPFGYGEGILVSDVPENFVVVILGQEYDPTNAYWYFINDGVNGDWLSGWVRGDAFASVNNCPPIDMSATANAEEIFAYASEIAPVVQTAEAQITMATSTPLPPAFSLVATPTAYFNPLIGDGQFSAVTVRPLMNIPSGTLVQITAAFYNGVEWSYEIMTMNGEVDSAREDELMFAGDILQPSNVPPDVPAAWTPTPIPTLIFTPTPAALCNVINRDSSSLRLYTRPASDAVIIGNLPPQITANVVRQERGSDGRIWYLISALVEGESQITGWLRADTITPSAACPPAS